MSFGDARGQVLQPESAYGVLAFYIGSNSTYAA